MFLILITPLLFGSVYPWAYSMIEVVTALMLGAWLVLLVTTRNSGGQKGDNRYASPNAIYGVVSGVGATRSSSVTSRSSPTVSDHTRIGDVS